MALSLTAADRFRGMLGMQADEAGIPQMASTLVGHREREDILRRCIDAAPVDFALFDREMRYLAVSRCYRDRLSLGDQDLIGKCLYDVLPDCAARCREIHERCLAGSTERCDADPFLLPDGTILWHRWEIRPWRDAGGRIGGLVLFREDVTEQQRAFADLAARERQARDLAQVAADNVWELDHNLRFTRGGQNDAYVGLAPWEIPGLDAKAPALQAHWADLHAHRPFRDFEFPIEEPDFGRLHFT